MINHENKRPVTLEEILRLKRAERPPAEFWTQFDRELRARQLAALVEKRPWWKTMPRLLTGLSRYHVPLGAAAVVALTLVSIREFRPVASAPTPSLQSQVEANATSPSRSPAAVESVVNENNSSVPVSGGAFAEESNAVSRPAALALNPDSVRTDSVAAAEETAVDSGAGSAPVENTFSVRPFAQELSAASNSTFGRNLLVDVPHGFETRAIPARTPKVDPLAQMASPSDARRSRLMNSAAAMAVSMSLTPTRNLERNLRRQISDEQTYENTVSRLVARGNSFGVKF